MRWLSLAVVLFGMLPSVASAQTPPCGFQLGFKLIADQIGTEVGQCLENEHFNLANGNAEQRTTAWHGKGGLLVWRKADNWTAYTDGANTWVNGPNGIQKRANTERFDFEAAEPAPAAQAPAAQPADPSAAITAMWQQLVAQAKQAALASAQANPNYASIVKGVLGGHVEVEVTAPIDQMRPVNGGPNVEFRGKLTIHTRLADSAGKTIQGIDTTDVTPFVKVAIAAPTGWVLSPGLSVLASGTCDQLHPVKGNTTTGTAGDWIYHVPGGAFYDRTKPEMCFATPAEAQAAGFRAPQR